MRISIAFCLASALALTGCNLTEEQLEEMAAISSGQDQQAADMIDLTPQEDRVPVDPPIEGPVIGVSAVSPPNPGDVIADTDHLDPTARYAQTEYWAFSDEQLTAVTVNVDADPDDPNELMLVVTNSITGAPMPRGGADNPAWRFLIRQDVMPNARAGVFRSADIGAYEQVAAAKGPGDVQDIDFVGETVTVHVTAPEAECGVLCAYVFESEGVFQVVNGAQSAAPISVNATSGATECADRNQSLAWAGDIDGDNRVDLVFHDVALCNETFRLLLSSEREDGQIFGDAHGAVFDGDASLATPLCSVATA